MCERQECGRPRLQQATGTGAPFEFSGSLETPDAAADGDTRAPASASLAPQTLDLALEQLHDTLKKCGAAQCENLITGEKTGYAQFVAALEKLSKMALDWEDRRKAETQNVGAKAPGYSEQTEFELEQKIEGPSAPKPQ